MANCNKWRFRASILESQSQAEFALKSGFAESDIKSLLLVPDSRTTRWPVQTISAKLDDSKRQQTYPERKRT